MKLPASDIAGSSCSRTAGSSSSLSKAVVVLVCLGQALLPNQTLPLSLQERVRTLVNATELFIDYQVTLSSLPETEGSDMNGSECRDLDLSIIFSGGDAAQCGITEANAMVNYYRDLCTQPNGLHQLPSMEVKTSNIIGYHKPFDRNSIEKIPNSKKYRAAVMNNFIELWLEDQSKNTVENAIYCRKLIESKFSHHSNISLVVISNSFHIPRCQLIFESVFGNMTSSGYCLIACPSKSGHCRTIPLSSSSNNNKNNCHAGLVSPEESRKYRPTHERPSNVQEWTLSERLDWEVNAVETLNSYLRKYDLPALPDRKLTFALQQLRALNHSENTMAGMFSSYSKYR